MAFAITFEQYIHLDSVAIQKKLRMERFFCAPSSAEVVKRKSKMVSYSLIKKLKRH